MQKLHPKAKWLFFLNAMPISTPFIIVLLAFVLPLIIIGISPDIENKEAQQQVSLVFRGGSIVVTIFIVLGVVFQYFWAVWTYNNYKYQLAEDAVKIEKGVIAKKYVSIPYDRIQNVDIERGIFARMLGLSDLKIQTAGYSGYTFSEGRLPGLDPQVAEQLREELIKRLTGTKQGL